MEKKHIIRPQRIIYLCGVKLYKSASANHFCSKNHNEFLINFIEDNFEPLRVYLLKKETNRYETTNHVELNKIIRNQFGNIKSKHVYWLKNNLSNNSEEDEK